MEKDVTISIRGLHNMSDDKDDVEMIAKGEYYNRNGKHYIQYNELSQDNNTISKNTIKIFDNSVEIVRKGVTNSHLTFKNEQKYLSAYATPFGNMLLGIYTSNIDICITTDEINIFIEYSVEINDEHLSNCNMNINIKSKMVR